jgi:hypothetical protein
MNRMMRWAVGLLLWIACDAGAPTWKPHHELTRAQYDLVLPASLPLRGFAIKTFGRPDYSELELIDLDVGTMRVIAGNSAKHIDQTLALAPSDVNLFTYSSTMAWYEKPNPVPDAAITETLIIADQDEVIDVSGDLIGAEHDRPNASALVRAVAERARGTLAQLAPSPPPPAPPAPPAPPPPKHTHSIARSSLPTADTKTRLPLHGVVVHSWGLGGDATTVIDADKTTIREVSNLMGKPPRDATFKGDAKQIKQIMELALAAWNEDGSAMPTATDVREDLYVLDGDEAFFLSGHPIAANGKTGRPLAVKAVNAVYRASR